MLWERWEIAREIAAFGQCGFPGRLIVFVCRTPLFQSVSRSTNRVRNENSHRNEFPRWSKRNRTVHIENPTFEVRNSCYSRWLLQIPKATPPRTLRTDRPRTP